jgi:hypothetical protein
MSTAETYPCFDSGSNSLAMSMAFRRFPAIASAYPRAARISGVPDEPKGIFCDSAIASGNAAKRPDRAIVYVFDEVLRTAQDRREGFEIEAKNIRTCTCTFSKHPTCVDRSLNKVGICRCSQEILKLTSREVSQ